MLDRRDFLVVIAASLGTVALGSPMLRVLAGETPIAAGGEGLFSELQSRQVALLAEMVIPRTDTPGALDAGVPAFIGMMVAKWYTDLERQIFLDGLQELDAHCRDRFGKDFIAAGPEQREAALVDAEQRALSYVSPVPGGFFSRMSKVIDEQAPFFTKLKELTVIGFLASEVGAKQFLAHNPIPMRFDGDWGYPESGRQWSY